MTKKILILATGGTIASRYDPRHDDVRAVGQASDLAAWLGSRAPGLSVQARDIMTVNSYQMDLPDLYRIVQEIRSAVRDDDVAGVVVTHGTDTLEESAFMAGLLVDSDKPVVFTGAQRSADDPYSDGPPNLLDAVRVASSPAARGHGVLVVFSQEIHAARWVSKVDASALRAFGSPGLGALGTVDGERVQMALRPHAQPVLDCPAIESRIDLIRLCVGADARFIDCAIDSGTQGIVIEALGRGNATASVLEGVRRAIASRIPVVVTSRCPEGLVAPVYGGSGGAGLTRAGAIFGAGFSGAKARILMSVLLGRPGWRDSFDADMASFSGRVPTMH